MSTQGSLSSCWAAGVLFGDGGDGWAVWCRLVRALVMSVPAQSPVPVHGSEGLLPVGQ